MKHKDPLQNREPAVAGQFYPSDATELEQLLKMYFAIESVPTSGSDVMAIISPHAGYVFSGEVAAEAFIQLDPAKQYKTIFVIGSSHRNSFPGASVYSIGNYTTPLGTVQTDFEIARHLANEHNCLSYDPNYHNREHSIEVQLPFLQYWLKSGFRIVPVLLGTQDKHICEKIAQALKPYFTTENLFVISSDFSHYPSYNEAKLTDKLTADALADNNPEKFLQSIFENVQNKKIAGLATACCSWPSVLTLLLITKELPGIEYKQLKYKNSGDSGYGEKDSVVGYWAFSIIQKQDSMNSVLNTAEREKLLQIARKTIISYLNSNRLPYINPADLPAAMLMNAGAFVSLKKQGELRGCIGHFEADVPLYKMVQQMAVASSTEDYRFSRITEEEMLSTLIEISVLTPLQRVEDPNTIRLGTDGIYIKKGNRSGTFLPQVATDTGWSLEEFLGHCARDKAGIGWDGWKDIETEIFVYQAIVFSERD